MNIKRFVAPDMREALRAIRENLGADAVMLSSRSVAEGVEVIAAIDYDDSLFSPVAQTSAAAPALAAQPAAKPAAPPPPSFDESAATAPPELTDYQRIVAALAQQAEQMPATRPADRAVRYAVAPARPAAVTADRSAAPPPPAAAIEPAPPPDAQPPPVTHLAPPRRRSRSATAEAPREVAAELKDLRHLLEGQLASLAWNDINRRDPVGARVLRQFAQLGIDPVIVKGLIKRLPKVINPRDAWRVPLQLLAGRLMLANRELTEIGGTFAIVGPTGVGKTTTIAKMAARFVLRHGASGLGLVSTDSYRIGAREQLLTFARILGTPMHVAASARELQHVLDGMRDKQLILIDTAGMSQRDVRLTNQFATLRVRGHRVRTILALSAAADRGCLREALAAFRAAEPQAMIVTKIDESTTLGPLLSLALQAKLPIAYLSDGQRVPEDLQLAGRRRSWLIQTALRLAHDHTPKPDETELAEQFARIGRVANA